MARAAVVRPAAGHRSPEAAGPRSRSFRDRPGWEPCSSARPESSGPQPRPPPRSSPGLRDQPKREAAAAQHERGLPARRPEVDQQHRQGRGNQGQAAGEDTEPHPARPCSERAMSGTATLTTLESTMVRGGPDSRPTIASADGTAASAAAASVRSIRVLRGSSSSPLHQPGPRESGSHSLAGG